MTLEQACQTANEFVKTYLSEKRYFTPPDDLANEDAEGTELFVCQLHHFIPENGAMLGMFFYGASVDLTKHDPQAAVDDCVQALVAAHPELEHFSIETELDVDED